MKVDIIKERQIETKLGTITYFSNDLIKDKESIILLHPAYSDHHMFNCQLSRFSEKYNLILIDLPGHGSKYGLAQGATIGVVPTLLSALLQSLSIAKVHVLGVSLGSLIGQAFADQYPDMVLSVTVVGGYSIHLDISDVMKEQKKEMAKWVLMILFSMKRFRKYVVNVSVKSAYGKEIMTKGIANFRRRGLSKMRGMNQLFRRSDEDKSYPLLAIVGEYDLDLAKTSAVKLGSLKNGRYHMIMDAGHCANIDQPENFNRLYMDFIKEHSRL